MAGIDFGGAGILELRRGADPVLEVRRGTDLVWSSTPLLPSIAIEILRAKGADFFLFDFLARTDLTYQVISSAAQPAADNAGEAVGLALGTDGIGDIVPLLAGESELMDVWSNGGTSPYDSFVASGSGFTGSTSTAKIGGARVTMGYPVTTADLFMVEIIVNSASRVHGFRFVNNHSGAGGTRSNTVVIPQTASRVRVVGFVRPTQDGTFYPQINNEGAFISSVDIASVSIKRMPAEAQLDTFIASQPERVTGGEFSDGLASWANGDSGTGVSSIEGNALRLIGTDNSNRAFRAQNVALQAGRTYALRWSASTVSGTATISVRENSTGGTVLALANTGTGGLRYFIATATTNVSIRTDTAGGNVLVDNVSIKEVPGHHATQVISTSYRPTRQADGSLKGDGLDDSLLSTLTSGASMCILVAMLGGANPASGVGALVGGPVGTSRGYLARDPSGRLCAGVGADDTATIVGGGSLAGLTGVAILNVDATGKVDLEWMPRGGALASLYSEPINGALAAGTPLCLWATNAAGVAANYGADHLYLAAAVKTKLTPAERLAIATEWNARMTIA